MVLCFPVINVHVLLPVAAMPSVSARALCVCGSVCGVRLHMSQKIVLIQCDAVALLSLFLMILT